MKVLKKVKMIYFVVAVLVIANLSIDVSYSLQVQGYDPSARRSPTYVELSTGEIVHLANGESRLFEGRFSCVIVRRGEVGWIHISAKSKPHISISLRKTDVGKPEPIFCMLALVDSRRCRVLLFSPELPHRTYPGRPPIYYLSSILRQKGFPVMTIDVDIAGRQEFVKLLRDFKPDLVGGTSLSIQINEAMGLMELAKKYCPDALTVLGGNHATAAGEYLYPFHKDYLDVVAVGEGLTTLELIAQAVAESRWETRRSEIPGLLQWDGSQVVRNLPAGPEHPDRFFPDMPYHPSYNFSIFNREDGSPRRTFQCMTVFGCKNACFFCFNSTNFRGEATRCERKMDLSVVEAILCQAKSQGYEAVYFDDDTFTRDSEHALGVARLCKKYKLVFGCHTRPDCEDEELIREFAANGCVYIFSGFETIVPEILLGANKTKDPVGYREAYIQSFRLKSKLGIPASAFMIFGMPRRIKDNQGARYEADTLEDSRASLEFAIRELDPTFISMNILRFIPGVPFSFGRPFEFLRPMEGVLHGGYWDRKWLEVNGKADLRSFHPVLHAFESVGDIIPTHMTPPERGYQILNMAVDMVNAKNAEPGRTQTRIVVDPLFEKEFLRPVWSRGVLHYALASFEAMS